MANGLDHNSVTIALFTLSLVMAIIGVLIRGWFKHVNNNLEKLWERMDAEAERREERWNHLHNQCNSHGERISRIEGKLNGSTIKPVVALK